MCAISAHMCTHTYKRNTDAKYMSWRWVTYYKKRGKAYSKTNVANWQDSQLELDIWHGGLLDNGMVILGMRSYVCVSDVKQTAPPCWILIYAPSQMKQSLLFKLYMVWDTASKNLNPDLFIIGEDRDVSVYYYLSSIWRWGGFNTGTWSKIRIGRLSDGSIWYVISQRLFAMETLVSVLFMRLLEELITRCSQGKSIWCSKVPKKVLFFLGGGGGVVHELWVRFQQWTQRVL